MRKLLLTAALAVLSFAAYSQADTSEQWFINGDIYTVSGDVYQSGALGIRGGKIIYVGPAENAPVKGKTTDVTGKRIYPGLIALNSILGLSEVEAVRSTNDFSEVGGNNANVRSAIAFNTDSKVIPTVVSNGILVAQVCPRGGLISGSSSVMKLQARNWEEATYSLDNVIHINWPSFTGDEKKDKKANEQVSEITCWLSQAKSYSQQKTKETNLKYDALKDIFTGKKKVFVHVDEARGIISAVQTFAGFGIRPVIVGGEESGLITAFLKEHKIPVIISRTHRLPGSYDDSYDATYSLPAQLYKDSIPFAISDINFWEQRNLPFQAGMAVGFGLPYEEALKSITLYPAQLLDIDSSAGSLEVGKHATFIISTGDILDMRTSNVEAAYIQGKPVDLDNHQKQLYRKYLEGWKD